MSNKTAIKFILFFVALLFFALRIDSAHAVKAAAGKSDFVFAIRCEQESSQGLCLVGKFKAKTKVTLLQSEPKKICAAVTTSRGEKLELCSGYLTELAGSCEAPNEYAIGIIRKPVKDYERLILKDVVDTETVSKIARLVRSSKALRALREKAQGSIPGETKELGGVTPKVYQVSIPGLHILVASFEDSNENIVSGPRLVVINDHVYPLTGWCSYRTLNIFRLEGRYYIQTGSCCCGCGITVMELFRITPEGPVEVVSDWSLSD